MSPTDLLTVAAGLTQAQVDKMAHALGWPDTANIRRPGRAVKWANPYRNYYCGSAGDPEWTAAVEAGLAQVRPDGRYLVWHVTDLGQRAVRLRLMSERVSPREDTASRLRALLAVGPAATRTIAHKLGVTPRRVRQLTATLPDVERLGSGSGTTYALRRGEGA